MPAFPFQNIILHQLPDNQGWQIIGVHHNHTQEILATLAPVIGWWLAGCWADMTAKNLAGQHAAEID